MSTAYFLVTHGSSDPRSQLALQEVIQLTKAELTKSQLGKLLVGGSCLEGQELTLAQHLQQFGALAQEQGYSKVMVMPLFLLSGVHVCIDIPEQVAIARDSLPNTLQVQIALHLGAYPQIIDLLNAKFQKLNAEFGAGINAAKILVTHGSKRTGANQVIAELAEKLDAITAYWSVPPNLEMQIEQFIQQGKTYIAVLPYFLFAGGITEAIAQIISKYTKTSTAQIKYMHVAISAPEIAALVSTEILANKQFSN